VESKDITRKKGSYLQGGQIRTFMDVCAEAEVEVAKRNVEKELEINISGGQDKNP